MDTGVTAALIHLRQTGGVVVALRTQACEGVDPVDAGSSIVTRVDGAIINIDVAHGACVARLTSALVAVYLVDTLAVVTGLTLAVVQVYFTVKACGAFGAGTNVGVFFILTGASVLTGLAQTLIDIGLTETASVTRTTVAGERGQAIHTGTVVTRTRVTLIDICLTMLPSVAFFAFTGVLVRSIVTVASILTGSAGTFIYIHLTQTTRETFRTLAVEGVDPIDAFSVVQTGIAGALVGVDLTEHSLIAWHADAVEASNLVETGGVILAWVGHTLIYIHLTARTLVTLETAALE